ncbi:recombinase family protein [Streptomyces kaempferi]
MAGFLAGSEAAAVRDAAPAVLAGASLKSLGKKLAALGLESSRGKSTDNKQLRAILLRPRNAGLMQHRGEIVGRAAWMPLVDEPTWRSLVAVLEEPSRIPSAPNTRKYLGSGIYECGDCKEKVTGAPKPRSHGEGKQLIYRCSQGCVSRDMESVDGYVLWHILGRLSREDAVDLLAPREESVDVRALQAEMRAARTRLDEIAAQYGRGEMDGQEWSAMSGPARSRLKVAQDKMSSAVEGNPLKELVEADDPVVVWNVSFDLSRQRAAVDYAVTVTLGKARPGRQPDGSYFDKSSVQVRWKK